MGKRSFVLAAPNPFVSFLLHCRLTHYLTHHPLSPQVYTSVSLLSRFSLLVEYLFWINFPQMYLQFSKLTLMLLFSAHVSIFSKTLYYLPVLTAAGTTCNLTSSVNFITMLVLQFQIIYANFTEDSTLNRALWHPYSQLIQLTMCCCLLSCFICVLYPDFQSMWWSSDPSQFELIWKVRFHQTSYWMLYQNPDDILFPFSIAFVTVPQKIINICTAQFSLHKSRLLIGHGSIIFLSALRQFRIKPCIKLYITWDLAAGKW